VPKLPVTVAPASERERAADPASWANALETVPLFAGLGRRHLKKVAAAGRIARFHDGTTIVRAGEAGDAMFVVIDGEVLVRRRGASDVRMGIGSFFGEMSLLDGGARSADVIADGPVVCLAVTRPRFMKVLRAEPSIAIAMLAELASRLRTAHAAS
jgi:CRP-like cAMP-binding protein